MRSSNPLLALLALGGCIVVPARPQADPPPPPRPVRYVRVIRHPRPPPPSHPRVHDDDPPPPVMHDPAPPPPPARRDGKNPFPDDGPQLTDEQLDAIPDYDRDKQYTYGALVKEGFSSEPHEMAFRCGQEKCEDSPPGDGWSSAGWY